MEQNKAKKPLQVALFQLVCQTVLDRMLTLAKVSQTSQEWDQAVKNQLTISEGKWAFLQLCSEPKCVKQTTKLAIDMVKMQKLLEDLVGSGEQHLGDSQPPLPRLDLARHSSQGETAQSEREPLGHFLGQILEAAGRQDVKWPIQQEEVKGTLLALRLINPDNRCFSHATMLAFFWGFLHLQNSKWSDLGGAAQLLMDMCTRSSLYGLTSVTLKVGALGLNHGSMDGNMMPMNS